MSRAYRGNSSRPDSCQPQSEAPRPGVGLTRPVASRPGVGVSQPARLPARTHSGSRRNSTRATPEGQPGSNNCGETGAYVRAYSLLFLLRDPLVLAPETIGRRGRG